tara:strand:- start:41 stop:391 length:351 start_codon:yes stop_codon:yes gene_type:complete
MPVEKRTNNYSDSIRKAAEELGLSKPVKTNSSQIEQIFTGWANVVKDRFNILDDKTKALAELRMKVCNDCSLRVGGTCSPKKTGLHAQTGVETKGCGCGLAAKTLSPASHCPLGKW